MGQRCGYLSTPPGLAPLLFLVLEELEKNHANHFGAFAGKTRVIRLKHGPPPPGSGHFDGYK